ncbi:AAA family ATPase [Cellulomonas dongxiuzhuiae]|uniref:AAA family ATPase n=1 Tax=Cellulomonas dongxiuzhuiae TaxID=2819979 RepID=A0ABX8GNC7_9CELL|nr:AAA family ATPase [Cellulomonas dongxiuzhuiae]QWC17699.1 AAA family ATPase [Cellulomonas dongxiuzhuiae]
MTHLVGRHSQIEAVEKLLSLARAGHSGAVVVSGEAGIGKTAVLQHAQQTAVASGFRVETSVGVESESQFAFAGLHQLCAPLLDRAGTLPEPQRAALGVAFGLHGGVAPDRFLVGLATLHLLAEAAEEAPLLCLVDDAQWLDEASVQVLAFVARRVGAERLALVFGLRDSGEGSGDRPPVAGLPELRLERLDEADARALLGAALHGPLDEGVRERFLAEARGNPLALLELPRSIPTGDFAGGFELPDVLDVPHRVEESFRRRSDSLPPETQRLLLLVASEPTGDAALLWRAVGLLGLAREVAMPAEQAGLLEVGARLRFRHPLMRSAVYRAATPPDRRRAHAALAEATDPQVDPDRCAWHRAQAVLGADEEAAEGLELSAGRARARGGVAAAAAFLQRAAELSPDPAARARRALEGAEAKHEAGASEAAQELLTIAAAGPLDALQHARVALLRAQVAFHLTRDGNAPRMLLDAARMLAPLAPALSRETFLHALDAAVHNGSDDVTHIAEAALAAPAADVPARPVDLLLDGLATTLTRGYAAGARGLWSAVDAVRASASAGPGRDPRSDGWLWLAGRTAVGLFDDDLLHDVATRNVQLVRECGALARLPAALNLLSITSVLMGDLARADELAAEAASIMEATGGVELRHARVILGGWAGDHATTTALSASTAQDDAHPDRGTDATQAQYALAVLHNGMGSYARAREAATRACTSPEVAIRCSSLTELIEACVRSGQPEDATQAMEEFSARARVRPTPWSLGLEAYARALMSTGQAAEDQYRAAIEHLGRSRMRGYLARAHLVHGEWLRREGRRRDARDQLRTAHELLSDMGADAFAARAARELRATGEHPRARAAQPTDELTTQELHVARLVATGATSREVGARLFLSPRTVEAHLRNIFRKLGITSRRELRELQLT